MTDFKVGDKVKVEFECEICIDKAYDINFYRVEDKYGARYDFPSHHITLIERAKPELKVGQIWSDGRHEYIIIGFYNDYVVYWSKTVNRAFNSPINSFYKYYAHKLIGEAENG